MKTKIQDNFITSILKDKSIESKCKVLEYFNLKTIEVKETESSEENPKTKILALDEIASTYKANNNLKEEIDNAIDTCLQMEVYTLETIDNDFFKKIEKEMEVIKAQISKLDPINDCEEIMNKSYDLFVMNEASYMLYQFIDHYHHIDEYNYINTLNEEETADEKR